MGPGAIYGSQVVLSTLHATTEPKKLFERVGVYLSMLIYVIRFNGNIGVVLQLLHVLKLRKYTINDIIQYNYNSVEK